MRMWFATTLVVFGPNLPTAVAGTGPAGTQRLGWRRAGSGVGASTHPRLSRMFTPGPVRSG